MLFDIIGWLIFGVIVGALARLLMPGRDPMGCLMTAVLGIAGSLIGGFIGNLIWPRPERATGFSVRPGWILSILGAMLLLWIYRMTQRRS
jgi:uncharacterized membrane protein YeaQ/YmgE (transglycosylase-associated protein family)